jgi:hypothetical protein
MKTILISKRWNHPQIAISMNASGIKIEMSVDDFVTALADESAEVLAAEIAGNAGNPLALMTNAQLTKRIVEAVESESARRIFADAAERVFSGMKAETAKVV